MRQGISRWWSTGVLGIGLLTIGCGRETPLRDLVPGLAVDSVVALLGAPHHQESYLAGGHLWQILYYGEPTDSTSSRELVPVVLADERVVGIGWSYWDAAAHRLRIATPPR